MGKPEYMECKIQVMYRSVCPNCRYNFSSNPKEHGKISSCPNCSTTLTMVDPKHKENK